MKKNTRAYFAITTFLTVLAIVVSVVGAGAGAYCVFNNWEEHEEFTMEFNANEKTKTSDYYACKCDSLDIYQKSGSTSSKYDVYYKARTQKSYDTIYTGLTFSENNCACAPFSLSSHWWNDVCFQVKKTASTTKASALVLSLGQSTD